MSNNPIAFTPGPSASTAVNMPATASFTRKNPTRYGHLREPIDLATQPVETVEDTVTAIKRAAQNGRIEQALDKVKVPTGTLVKTTDGKLYRTVGKDSRTLKRVSARFTKAERKRFKMSRHAMRALTASLDDGVVDRLPPMPRADHVDPQAVCFEPSTLSLSPGNCGFAPGHEGPHSWEQG